MPCFIVTGMFICCLTEMVVRGYFRLLSRYFVVLIVSVIFRYIVIIFGFRLQTVTTVTFSTVQVE